MRKPAVMALDLGSQSAKALVFDFHGKLISVSGASYPWLHPEEKMIEIDPEEVWEAAQSAVEEVVSKTHLEYELKAMSFSYFGHGMLTVDENYNPTDNIILFADTRSMSLKDELTAAGADKVMMEVTRSSAFSPTTAPVKVLWLKRNKPEIYEKTAYLFDVQQFILARLGLEPVNDGTMADCKNLFDAEKKQWSERAMDAFSVPRGWLNGTRVVGADTPVGKITKFGRVDLKSSVVVSPGAHDTECGVLGMGAIPENPGVLSDSMGTYHQCGFLSEHRDSDVLPSGWAQFITKCGSFRAHMVSTSNGGSSLRWFISTFCGGEPIYDELFGACRFDGKNPSFFVPSFSHENAGIFKMTLSRTREEIFEALIEGITMTLANGYDGMREKMRLYQGCEIKEIRAMGGCSRADKFLQLRATVFNIPVVRSSHIQGTGAGAAMLASVGAGAYKNYKEASDNIVVLTDRFEPDMKLRPVYMEKLSEFNSIKAGL